MADIQTQYIPGKGLCNADGSKTTPEPVMAPEIDAASSRRKATNLGRIEP